jgi:hypothetical protein
MSGEQVWTVTVTEDHLVWALTSEPTHRGYYEDWVMRGYRVCQTYVRLSEEAAARRMEGDPARIGILLPYVRLGTTMPLVDVLWLPIKRGLPLAMILGSLEVCHPDELDLAEEPAR